MELPRTGAVSDANDSIIVGRGLYHIQQRGHDRELLRFSNGRYNVLNAMYDLLKRWDKQGNKMGKM